MGNLQSFMLQTIQFHIYIKDKFRFPAEANNLVLSLSSSVLVFPERAHMYGAITQVCKNEDMKLFFKEKPSISR